MHYEKDFTCVAVELPNSHTAVIFVEGTKLEVAKQGQDAELSHILDLSDPRCIDQLIVVLEKLKNG